MWPRTPGAKLYLLYLLHLLDSNIMGKKKNKLNLPENNEFLPSFSTFSKVDKAIQESRMWVQLLLGEEEELQKIKSEQGQNMDVCIYCVISKPMTQVHHLDHVNL